MDMFLPHLHLSELEEECFSKVLPKVSQFLFLTMKQMLYSKPTSYDTYVTATGQMTVDNIVLSLHKNHRQNVCKNLFTSEGKLFCVCV